MFPGGVNYATSRVSILVGRIVGFGIQFLLSDRVSLGREGLIVFAFLPDLSQQVGWPSAGFAIKPTSRLTDYSQLVG